MLRPSSTSTILLATQTRSTVPYSASTAISHPSHPRQSQLFRPGTRRNNPHPIPAEPPTLHHFTFFLHTDTPISSPPKPQFYTAIWNKGSSHRCLEILHTTSLNVQQPPCSSPCHPSISSKCKEGLRQSSSSCPFFKGSCHPEDHHQGCQEYQASQGRRGRHFPRRRGRRYGVKLLAILVRHRKYTSSYGLQPLTGSIVQCARSKSWSPTLLSFTVRKGTPPRFISSYISLTEILVAVAVTLSFPPPIPTLAWPAPRKWCPPPTPTISMTLSALRSLPTLPPCNLPLAPRATQGYLPWPSKHPFQASLSHSVSPFESKQILGDQKVNFAIFCLRHVFELSPSLEVAMLTPN